MPILITGGAGFIGTALCRHLLEHSDDEIIVLDKLTYAANTKAVAELSRNPRYTLVQADICNFGKVDRVLRRYNPSAVLNLAAESHVDRSIENAADFVETNIKGTMVLLEAIRKFLASLNSSEAESFRFLHVSTDEVFGDLADLSGNSIFKEDTPYNPSSPYAASKAASDHLVRAWCRTYRIPSIITNCTNNYGPEQYPEKLIPLVCKHARNGWTLPVYGDGHQTRDWIHVSDHARALQMVLKNGRPGQTYAIGARNEVCNLDLVRLICRTFDKLVPERAPHEHLIRFVTDRPGHDRRYAVDPQKVEVATGWKPEVDFKEGIENTIRWYLNQKPEANYLPHQIPALSASGRATA
ncbi:dTDP-glucose 4,6-dehydratase [uncultured Roseibium sp.]|uniref:dTDP-glucose 4,6-dehydratase n=1 Tax=uncultured Roseibium sp. TaxID=1936171 RepID=UPI0026045B97|nr:dTDP-glucose 4,6-dehydratase [uncultured Roseibium sp.]